MQLGCDGTCGILSWPVHRSERIEMDDSMSLPVALKAIEAKLVSPV